MLKRQPEECHQFCQASIAQCHRCHSTVHRTE